METKTNSYIKADNNIVINEHYIRWIKKIDECLEVCTKQSGCMPGTETQRICKINTPDSYHKLNVSFDKN